MAKGVAGTHRMHVCASASPRGKEKVSKKTQENNGKRTKRKSLFAGVFPQAYEPKGNESGSEGCRKIEEGSETKSTAKDDRGRIDSQGEISGDPLDRALREFGLERKEELGRGSFAHVFRAQVVDESIAPKWATAYATHGVAVKALLSDASKRDASSFRREMRLHARLPYHPNVVRARCAHVCSDAPFLATDYCRCGNLRSKIRDARTQLDAPELAVEVARGVAHLHQNGVAHRDVKSANVMLALDESRRTLNAQLADLGSASALEESLSCEEWGPTSWWSVGMASTSKPRRVGTVPWMAPEMLAPDAERKWPREAMGKMDVFGCGCVVWELLTRQLPWRHVQGKDWRENIAHRVAEQGERLSIPEYTSPKLRELMLRCWDVDPVARPTAQELVELLESVGPWDETGRVERQAISASSTLSVVWPWRAKQTFYVGFRPSSVLGRSPRCEFPIRDKHVSRKHCRVFVDDESQWYVEDLDSANGTRLNGGKLQAQIPEPLQHGDVILLADAVRIRFLQERK